MRRFSRERADGSAPWQAFPVVQADQVHGRWRMHARVIEWELLDLPDRPTWWQQFVTLIRELAREAQTAFLVATHDSRLVEAALKRFALSNGRLCKVGAV